MKASASSPKDERDEALWRLRSLRNNYAVRARYSPQPPLAWGDAVEDLDDVLAALAGVTWAERRGILAAETDQP